MPLPSKGNEMKRNNIKLEISKGIYVSIAQHFDDNGEMLCNEMAVVTQTGLQEPLPFIPNISDFLKCILKTITESKDDS